MTDEQFRKKLISLLQDLRAISISIAFLLVSILLVIFAIFADIG